MTENTASTTSTIPSDAPQSAIQKMADYMRRHDYGMGDKDKYMQDPEWIALNAELQEDIKQRERDMEQYLDVRSPKDNVFDANIQNSPQNIFVKTNKFEDMTSGFAAIDIENDDSGHNIAERVVKAVEEGVRGEGRRGVIKTVLDYAVKWFLPFIRLITNEPTIPLEHIEVPDAPRTEQVIVEDSMDMSKKSILGITEDGTTIKMDFDEDSNSYGVKISIDSDESNTNENLARAADELTDFLSDVYLKMYYDRKKREDEELAKKLSNPDE